MRLYSDFSEISAPLRVQRTSAARGETTHLGAFSREDTLELTLDVHRALGCTGVELSLTDDDSGFSRSFTMQPAGGDLLWDSFTLMLPLSEISVRDGLFWCRYGLDTMYGRLWSDYGNPGQPRLSLSWDAPAEQMTVYDPAFDTPAWIGQGIMYHVFVDRFCPGGDVPCRADATRNPDWENGIPEFAEEQGGKLSNTTFFGGTLWGIAEKMAYIASLGTRCLYLSPVFEARSNHKYDTGDYLRVDDMFGGDAALKALIDCASAYGIRVILDGVFNHTGDDSRYFNRYGHYPPEGACDSPDSPYYPWYTFTSYPDRYRCWWDIDILPAVRSENASYLAFICDEVVPKWGKMGIGGWRLDVADELAPVFLESFRHAVKAVDSEAVIYGEVWEDASNKTAYGVRRRYFRGHQLDAVMNYPLREAAIAFARDGDGEFLRDTMMTLVHNYPPQVLRMQMNHLGTHDTERILNVLAGACGDGYSNRELSVLRLEPEARALGLARLRCAYVTIACLPGVPCVYYGDEAGMEGWRDPFNRRPFPWGHEEQSLLAHYRRIGGLRASSQALAEGELAFLEAGQGRVLFSRMAKDETLLIAVNTGSAAYSFTVDRDCRDVFDGTVYADGERITVEPLAWKILEVK